MHEFFKVWNLVSGCVSFLSKYRWEMLKMIISFLKDLQMHVVKFKGENIRNEFYLLLKRCKSMSLETWPSSEEERLSLNLCLFPSVWLYCVRAAKLQDPIRSPLLWLNGVSQESGDRGRRLYVPFLSLLQAAECNINNNKENRRDSLWFIPQLKILGFAGFDKYVHRYHFSVFRNTP